MSAMALILDPETAPSERITSRRALSNLDAPLQDISQARVANYGGRGGGPGERAVWGARERVSPCRLHFSDFVLVFRDLVSVLETAIFTSHLVCHTRTTQILINMLAKQLATRATQGVQRQFGKSALKSHGRSLLPISCAKLQGWGTTPQLFLPNPGGGLLPPPLGKRVDKGQSGGLVKKRAACVFVSATPLQIPSSRVGTMR